MIGHSRTVVGIEERKNRTLCLLVFDPGCLSREMQKLLKQDMEANSLKQLRKFVGNLKHKQYQIVAVEGVLTAEEKIVSLYLEFYLIFFYGLDFKIFISNLLNSKL